MGAGERASAGEVSIVLGVAQFDVHRLGQGLVLDCQSDLLSELDNRVVAPLVLRSGPSEVIWRLNPVFSIDGQDYVMKTQFLTAVERRRLGLIVASLSDRSYDITGAIDVLTGGV